MRRTLALALLTALPISAQHIDDPANLMGERVSAPSLADTLPINHGAPALEQLLRKLRTRASMMMIVAHPDDEDSGLLTLESRGAGARVAMLTLTRGEGGQNLMSADFDDALGLIRTQELLAEDRYTGVDQMFGTEVDFGFSKTKEETLEKWGHDRVLYDAVRAVRLYRPLVLASVFVGGVTDGHGHHQVAGEITQEVFTAAGDPKVFPEMGLPPWTPLKVYARTPFFPVSEKGMFDYATGRYSPVHFYNYVTKQWSNTTPDTTITIHEGDKPGIPAFNGMSYVQWARQGLALQKTQIGRNMRIPPAGAADVGYTLMGSHLSKFPAHESDLFEGIDTSLVGIAALAPNAPLSLRSGLREIDSELSQAQRLYDPNRLELTAPPLAEALRSLQDLIKSAREFVLDPQEKFNVLHELRVKQVQANEALLLALSVNGHSQTHLVRASDQTLRPAIITISDSNLGDAIPLHTTWFSPLANQLAIGKPGKAPTSTTPIEHSVDTTLAPHGRIFESCPYFEKNESGTFYTVALTSLRDAPSKPPYVFTSSIDYDGLPTTYVTEIQNDDSPLEIVPPINITMPSKVGVFHPSDPSFPIAVELSSDSSKEIEGTLTLQLPDGWTSTPESFPFTLIGSNSTRRTFSFLVKPTHAVAQASYTITAKAHIGLTDYTRGYRRVGYPGITNSVYCPHATFKASLVDVTAAPNLHIAYLPGTGDAVPQFLPSLGVTPTILTVADLTPNNLAKYDAVVLGVRAYSAHPELSDVGSQALNEYARQGGVILSQYMSGGFNPASAPYPLEIPGDSAHNVVDEAQPVTLLQPRNPLLTWPNKITPADFDHWVAERGHGFAAEWAPEYQPLLETHDPDQDPQKGGLLVAKVGKGAYIYCSLALYRQLPEGVPGAYRLLANLLSYAKNPSR